MKRLEMEVERIASVEVVAGMVFVRYRYSPDYIIELGESYKVSWETAYGVMVRGEGRVTKVEFMDSGMYAEIFVTDHTMSYPTSYPKGSFGRFHAAAVNFGNVVKRAFYNGK
jgi:hypothetical protein